MSGSFESLRWNACVHRLHLGLYSHPKEFGGNGVRTHVKSKGEIPSTGGKKKKKKKLRGGSKPRRCIKQDSEPNTLPMSYSGPNLLSVPCHLCRPMHSTSSSHLLRCSMLLRPPRWPSGTGSASRAADLGSIPAFAVDLFPGQAVPVT